MKSTLWLEDLKRRDHLEDLGVDGRIILKLTCANRVAVSRLDSFVSEYDGLL
jgi:hypothetical protein